MSNDFEDDFQDENEEAYSTNQLVDVEGVMEYLEDKGLPKESVSADWPENVRIAAKENIRDIINHNLENSSVEYASEHECIVNSDNELQIVPKEAFEESVTEKVATKLMSTDDFDNDTIIEGLAHAEKEKANKNIMEIINNSLEDSKKLISSDDIKNFIHEATN